jgi:hypothetical protein
MAGEQPPLPLLPSPLLLGAGRLPWQARCRRRFWSRDQWCRRRQWGPRGPCRCCDYRGWARRLSWPCGQCRRRRGGRAGPAGRPLPLPTAAAASPVGAQALVAGAWGPFPPPLRSGRRGGQGPPPPVGPSPLRAPLRPLRLWQMRFPRGLQVRRTLPR